MKVFHYKINLRLVLILAIAIFFPPEYFTQSVSDNRNHTFKKFSSAKKEVYRISKERKTFYCECAFNNKKQINLESCGYKFRKNKKRALRVEIEHVVPADKLCGKTQEWQSGNEKCIDSKGKHFKGRKCATEYNETCKMAYNDLHNLRPAIGEINNDRSDYSFSDIPGGKSNYGACEFKIQKQKVDPPANVHGDIARIYLHMNVAYPELNILNSIDTELFKKWSEQDPVSREECEYDNRIFQSIGIHNQFVYPICSKFR